MVENKKEGNEQTSGSQAYALLSIDGLNLLIPRNEIRSLVTVAEIRASAETEGNAMGYISFENGDWPVFSLSNQLIPMDSAAEASRICIILHIDNEYMGLLCDQIQNIEQQQTQDLSACMCTTDTPISGVLIYDNAVACVTSTRRLNSMLVTN